jgi:hypothetical protein
MSESEFEFLKAIALMTPVFIVLMALLVVRLAHWQDAREDRRRAGRTAPAP